MKLLIAMSLGFTVLIGGVAHAGAGAKMYNELVENEQIYADERWQRYVEDIGERLLVHSTDAGNDYTFAVLDNSQINAFATPDAFIFVNRGLIAFLKSEDELAAVIGHEIGHVVGKHSRRRRTADLFGKSIGLVAGFMTGRGELMNLSNAVTAQIVSGYGREMELEADRYGGEFLARAGYNPMAMIDVVQVLKDQELFSKQVRNRPSNYHGLFASHPKNDKRLHDAIAYANELLPDETIEPLEDFWDMVDGLAYGDEAAAGLVKEGKFYHGGLRVVIEFPENWGVANSSAQVRATAPGGDDVAVVTVARHEPVRRKSPQQYVTDVLKRDDLKTGAEVEINGNEAYVGEIEVLEGSEQTAEYIGIIYRAKDVFLFKGECGKNGDPEQCKAWFTESLEGLRPMTAADVQVANSRRIKVIVADPGHTYAKLAPSSSLREYPEETLRLLNAGHPNAEPRAGDYIKVVR